MTPLPATPYIAGNIVSQASFVGREPIIIELLESLDNYSVILLYGHRRIGKSSILHYLKSKISAPCQCVFSDLQELATKPLEDLVQKLMEDIGTGLHREGGIAAQNRAEFPEYFAKAYLPSVLSDLPATGRLVLLLDEVDVLDPVDGEVPEGQTTVHAFSYLHRLVKIHPQLRLVLVSGRDSLDLSSDFRHAFRKAKELHVSRLLPEESAQVIRLAELATEGRVQYTDEAAERIIEHCAGHPYFTQLLCDKIYDQLLSEEPSIPEFLVIDVDRVERAIPKVLSDDGTLILEDIWKRLSPPQRIALSAMAHDTLMQTSISEDDLIGVLIAVGIRLRRQEIADALHKLCQLELITATENGYRLIGRLLHQWIRVRKPLQAAKQQFYSDEILLPSLFQCARSLNARGQLAEAQKALEIVTKQSPQHIPAWRLLCEVYVDLGFAPESVCAYEQLYALVPTDPAVRAGFIDALLRRARYGGTPRAEAIRCCERILGFEPQHGEASPLLSQLLEEGLRQALADGRLDEALALRDHPRLSQPKARRQEWLFEVAKSFHAHGRLDEALQAVRQLLPSSDEAAERLRRYYELERELLQVQRPVPQPMVPPPKQPAPLVPAAGPHPTQRSLLSYVLGLVAVLLMVSTGGLSMQLEQRKLELAQGAEQINRLAAENKTLQVSLERRQTLFDLLFEHQKLISNGIKNISQNRMTNGIEQDWLAFIRRLNILQPTNAREAGMINLTLRRAEAEAKAQEIAERLAGLVNTETTLSLAQVADLSRQVDELRRTGSQIYTAYFNNNLKEKAQQRIGALYGVANHSKEEYSAFERIATEHIRVAFGVTGPVIKKIFPFTGGYRTPVNEELSSGHIAEPHFPDLHMFSLPDSLLKRETINGLSAKELNQHGPNSLPSTPSDLINRSNYKLGSDKSIHQSRTVP